MEPHRKYYGMFKNQPGCTEHGGKRLHNYVNAHGSINIIITDDIADLVVEE